MKSNKKNDKKESATQQLLNLKQFVPLQIGDNGAVAIEGEDGYAVHLHHAAAGQHLCSWSQ